MKVAGPVELEGSLDKDPAVDRSCFAEVAGSLNRDPRKEFIGSFHKEL